VTILAIPPPITIIRCVASAPIEVTVHGRCDDTIQIVASARYAACVLRIVLTPERCRLFYYVRRINMTTIVRPSLPRKSSFSDNWARPGRRHAVDAPGRPWPARFQEHPGPPMTPVCQFRIAEIRPFGVALTVDGFGCRTEALAPHRILGRESLLAQKLDQRVSSDRLKTAIKTALATVLPITLPFPWTGKTLIGPPLPWRSVASRLSENR
jgi:hypothetical protein